MEFQLNQIADFRLIGLKLGHKSSNENHKAAIDCAMLWQQFESEKWFDHIPDKLESNNI